MMRSRLLTALMMGLLVILSLIGVVGVSAQDDADTQFKVIILQDGDVYSGAFEGDKTAELYAFNGSAGDVVTISMVQEKNSDLDPFLVLLGERGQMFASDDDSGEAIAMSATISDFELPADGSYYILATSFAYVDAILPEGQEPLAEPQNYELSISGVTQPTKMEGYDPDSVLFFSTDVTGGGEGTAETTFEEPVYYFKFTASAGDVVNITTVSDNFDTIIHLFAPNGQRIAVNDDSDGTNSAITSFELPEDGEYVFFVTDTFFYTAVNADGTPNPDFTGVGEFDLNFG
jgi:hypothetical protein